VRYQLCGDVRPVGLCPLDEFPCFFVFEGADQVVPVMYGYRRGFLLYGLPGNGKTSWSASWPAIHRSRRSVSILPLRVCLNDALSELFQAAEDKAPALVILKDLGRIFGADGHDNRTAILLPHLLACLDGTRHAKRNRDHHNGERPVDSRSGDPSSNRAGSIDSCCFRHLRWRCEATISLG
jgi:hypothetical protein